MLQLKVIKNLLKGKLLEILHLQNRHQTSKALLNFISIHINSFRFILKTECLNTLKTWIEMN
jgi:hypothetical protein